MCGYICVEGGSVGESTHKSSWDTKYNTLCYWVQEESCKEGTNQVKTELGLSLCCPDLVFQYCNQHSLKWITKKTHTQNTTWWVSSWHFQTHVSYTLITLTPPHYPLVFPTLFWSLFSSKMPSFQFFINVEREINKYNFPYSYMPYMRDEMRESMWHLSLLVWFILLNLFYF